MKSTVSFTVEREIVERFRLGVLHRHGKLHGRLADEAAAALAARADELLAGDRLA